MTPPTPPTASEPCLSPIAWKCGHWRRTWRPSSSVEQNPSWIKLIIPVCCSSGNSLSHPSPMDSQTTRVNVPSHHLIRWLWPPSFGASGSRRPRGRRRYNYLSNSDIFSLTSDTAVGCIDPAPNPPLSPLVEVCRPMTMTQRMTKSGILTVYNHVNIITDVFYHVQ